MNSEKGIATKKIESKLSSKKALKLGLLSKDLIITQGRYKEKRGDYNSLLGSLIDQFQPEETTELLLIEKIATDYWRYKRMVRLETDYIEEELSNKSYNAIGKLDDCKGVFHIRKYTSSLEKNIEKNMEELQRIKKKRVRNDK
ncbi:hypothetical protein ACFL52_02630 [Candidatus Margulisiibacteriota bacterium]